MRYLCLEAIGPFKVGHLYEMERHTWNFGTGERILKMITSEKKLFTVGEDVFSRCFRKFL